MMCVAAVGVFWSSGTHLDMSEPQYGRVNPEILSTKFVASVISIAVCGLKRGTDCFNEHAKGVPPKHGSWVSAKRKASWGHWWTCLLLGWMIEACVVRGKTDSKVTLKSPRACMDPAMSHWCNFVIVLILTSVVNLYISGGGSHLLVNKNIIHQWSTYPYGPHNKLWLLKKSH